MVVVADDRPARVMPTQLSGPRRPGRQDPDGAAIKFPEPVGSSITKTMHDKIVNRLDVLGIKVPGTIPDMQFLGHGQMGLAYRAGDKVVKITTDESEARASFLVMNLKPESEVFTRYDDVFGFKDRTGHMLYAVVQEWLDKPEPAWSVFAHLWYTWRYRKVDKIERENRWNDKLDPQEKQDALDSFETPITPDNVLAFASWLEAEHPDEAKKSADKVEWLALVADELDRAGITYRDLKGDNLMRRGRQHVLIDLGLSKTGQAAKIPIISRLERLAREIQARGRVT
jgi:serine/threonine protein kinase